jgi:hypothetical protein
MSTLPTTHGGAADAPIACTLGPGEFRNRADAISRLAERALLTREPIDGGARLTFRGGDDVEDELRAVIAAEASCCSFLTLRLDHRDEALVLDVTGPAGAGPIIAELFA